MDIGFDNVPMVKNGMGLGLDAEAQATRVLKHMMLELILTRSKEHPIASSIYEKKAQQKKGRAIKSLICPH